MKRGRIEGRVQRLEGGALEVELVNGSPIGNVRMSFDDVPDLISVLQQGLKSVSTARLKAVFASMAFTLGWMSAHSWKTVSRITKILRRKSRHVTMDHYWQDMKAQLVRVRVARKTYEYELDFFGRSKYGVWKQTATIKFNDGLKVIRLINEAEKFLNGIGKH